LILKILKNEKLILNYEPLNELGKITKRKQPIAFMSSDASDDEKYAMAQKIGEILIAPPKDVVNTFEYYLVEG